MSHPHQQRIKRKKRDKDAYSVKKGNQWHFGYKAHIGVDKDSGLVHHLEVTGANEHDVTVTSKLMHGEEEEIYGDSGYVGAQNREDAVIRNNNGKKIKYKINRKPTSIKNYQKADSTQQRKVNIKSHQYVLQLIIEYNSLPLLFGRGIFHISISEYGNYAMLS